MIIDIRNICNKLRQLEPIHWSSGKTKPLHEQINIQWAEDYRQHSWTSIIIEVYHPELAGQI